MKLSEWAKKNGLTYQTAWNLFNKNQLPVKATQLQTGTILVENAVKNIEEKTFIYCRVSSHSRKKEMEYQINRCKDFCQNNGWELHGVYSEIASGVNDNRRSFWRMLSENPTRIIVENKDRLTRFGFLYLKRLLEKQGCSIVVINHTDEDHVDLIKDLTLIIYSFCARLYNIRKAKSKTQKCVAIINDTNE